MGENNVGELVDKHVDMFRTNHKKKTSLHSQNADH